MTPELEKKIEETAKQLAGFSPLQEVDDEERYYQSHKCNTYDACIKMTKSDSAKDYWQKGMYTEEEVYKTLHILIMEIQSSKVEINDEGDLREWFNNNNKQAVEEKEEMRKIMEGVMVNLKDNIWIEGFDNNQVAFTAFEKMTQLANGTIYAGETRSIPEELAGEYVQQNGLVKGTQLDDGIIVGEDVFFGYKNYKEGFGILEYRTAKESIQSACDKEYCIIIKK
jgi:hypothetical protein